MALSATGDRSESGALTAAVAFGRVQAQLIFAVKLPIRNPEGVLKPGMPADARIRWSPGAPWDDGLE